MTVLNNQARKFVRFEELPTAATPQTPLATVPAAKTQKFQQ